VRGTGPYGSLASILDELDALSDDAARETLASLRERLQSGRLRMLVVGEAKRGKSTLVNALLGREILPAGVTPLTAYGTPELARVAFLNGRTTACPLAELGDFVTERGNLTTGARWPTSPSRWMPRSWPKGWNWWTPRDGVGA